MTVLQLMCRGQRSGLFLPTDMEVRVGLLGNGSITYSVVVASIDSCASTSLARRTATTLDLSSSATRTLDPLISGQILRRRIDSQPSRCVSLQTLDRYPLQDHGWELAGHMFSNLCEGPVWLGRLSMEHLDPQHEEGLARVVVLIAACRRSRNEPFGKFEPCLRTWQTSREDEANNDQEEKYLSDQVSSKSTADRKKWKHSNQYIFWQQDHNHLWYRQELLS